MQISQLKNILGRKLSGANIDDVQGISDFTLFEEAAKNLLSEITPAETTRHSTLEVFTDIFDYDPPDDFRGLIDVRPQSATRADSDNPTRRFTEAFDQSRNNNEFTEEWQDGSKILRYAKNIEGNIGIHNMDGLDTNGTWDGTASNIALTTLNPFKGSGSINADYDTGEYIENDDMTQVDLSDHDEIGTLFIAAYFPDASFVTDVNLRWGNSPTVYWNRTVTAPQIGAFKNGWNIIPFAWNGATETGTVDPAAIDFIRVTLTLSTSDTDIRVDNIFSALGTIRDIVYYSTFLFRKSATVWLSLPTADSDIINLDIDAENIFVYECVRIAALGLANFPVYQEYTDMLYGEPGKPGMYDRYKQRTPDEEILPQTQYRKIFYIKK